MHIDSGVGPAKIKSRKSGKLRAALPRRNTLIVLVKVLILFLVTVDNFTSPTCSSATVQLLYPPAYPFS
jgi:hypothetical protein